MIIAHKNAPIIYFPFRNGLDLEGKEFPKLYIEYFPLG